MPMDSLVYRLNNVGIFYQRFGRLPWQSRKFWALENVSFDVHRGETLGIIGKNGAGKSTLLRLLAGITVPDRGEIQRANVRATMLSLGVGFEVRLTGRQNIVLSGLLLGMRRRYVKSQEGAIVELSGLGDAIDEPVGTYSSGMRARLGFCIAYYADTEVLLLDEALAPGDARFREKATSLIKEKIHSNHTVVFVSHSMDLVEELCTRAVRIEHGVSLPEESVKDTIAAYLAET